MKIYHYHFLNGGLTGTGLADPDPLVPGNWLIPAYATTVEPPSVPDGQFAAWKGDAWELRDIPAPFVSDAPAEPFKWTEPKAPEEQPAPADTPKAEG